MIYKVIGFKGSVILAIGVIAFGTYTGNLQSIIALLGLQQSSPTSASSKPFSQSAAEKELVEFVSVVLADTEETWSTIFQKHGKQYQEPKLVLFRGAVKSACGTAQSAMGPFYCPGDKQIYIDLGFYEQLRDRFNDPCDFDQAYVIDHEVGHHIQTLLGTSQKVHAKRSKLSEIEANKLSVLQELQADCYSGVWAFHADRTRQLLEAGDIDEGLAAASAIGDDTLQKQAQGYASPDSFTHGSSKQRVKWFKIGFNSGQMSSCNTFSSQTM
jgi:predicted metalloprotease